MNLLPDHAPAGPGTCPGYARRFDDWAASYDLSPLQTVLYGPVHDAVLRYARKHVRHPGMILDVGCGTGRLSARLASAYDQARVVGIDASTGMIQNAATTTVPRRSRFAAAMAERLPFADAVFDLVVVDAIGSPLARQRGGPGPDQPRHGTRWHPGRGRAIRGPAIPAHDQTGPA